MASRSSITANATQTGSPSSDGVRARAVIGADGAQLGRRAPVRSRRRQDPLRGRVSRDRAGTRRAAPADYDATRCDVYYQGRLSPDFYAWIFPHGDTVSIGVGSANKGFSLRKAVGALRAIDRPGGR